MNKNYRTGVTTGVFKAQKPGVRPIIPGRTGWALVATALAAVFPFEAEACTACNLNFGDEILNERADSLIGREVRQAMVNQAGLPLDDLSDVAPQVRADMASAAFASLGGAGGTAFPDLAMDLSVEPAPPPQTTAAPAESDAAPVVPAANATGNALSENYPDLYAADEFIEIIRRDEGLSIPTTSYVPQDIEADVSFTVELSEGLAYLGNGVIYDGFLTSGKIPGPTMRATEGDIVEFTVVNGGTIAHGASIHAANTQTSKYMGKIQPGETKSMKFRATQPGVYMYHCAPGGHAIPMHVQFGQYGMLVVEPAETKYRLEEELGREPDAQIYILQHALYESGKDAIEGNPVYTAFNGKMFRYVEEPINVRPGDYVRMYFLNVGPNELSTFHIVGIVWDYVYWQGHPENLMKGGQSVTAGPADSWVIEFRVPPDEGAYTMLDHGVGGAARGTIGLLVADRNAESPVEVLAEGPDYTQDELAEMKDEATRVVSPFRIGTSPADDPVVYGTEVNEVNVTIKGNSYSPKVLQVAPGTTVTWTNDDVFSYLAGEFSGIHNVVTKGTPPERFASPLLAHGEKFSFTFEKEGEYDYMCTPHPYMAARVIVKGAPEPDVTDVAESSGGGSRVAGWAFGLAGLAVLVSVGGLIRKR